MAVNVGQIEATLSADSRQFVGEMQRAASSFQNTANTISAGSASGVSSLQSLGNGVKGFQMTFTRSMALIGGAFILPSMLGAANDAIFGFNQTLDSARISMETFTGSAENAERLLGELQQFAALTPFNFSNLLRTSQQMMAMGVAADELIPRLTAIGDAAAALGGSPEILNRVQRALGQIQAKGRVQAEELLQLAEAGIPAYDYMAQAIGGSVNEALDMIKKGQIDATTAINALLDGMARDFGGMMAEQSRTMMGGISTVQDYIEMTVGLMGRPIFDAVKGVVLEIADFLGSDAAASGAEKFAKSFAAEVTAITDRVKAFIRMAGPPFVKTLKAAAALFQTLVKSVKAMAPVLIPVLASFGAMVIVVGELAAAFTPLIQFVGDMAPLTSALGAALLVLAARKRLVATEAGFMVKAFRKGIENARYMREQMASVSATFNSSSPLTYGMAVKSSMKAAAAAVRGFMAAVAPMVALTAGIWAASKAWEWYKNRGADAKAATEEITGKVKELTDAYIANEEGARKAGNAVDMFAQSLVTGDMDSNAGRTRVALGTLGVAADDMAAGALAVTENFGEYSKGLLLAQGVTSEMADQMIALVQYTDDNGDALDRFIDKGDGYSTWIGKVTDEQRTLIHALAELRDQYDNNKDAAQGVAQAQVDLAISSGLLSAAQITSLQNMMRSGQYYEAMNAAVALLALETDNLARAEAQRAAELERYNLLNQSLAERLGHVAGKSTELVSIGYNMERTFREMGNAANDVNDELASLIKTEGKVEDAIDSFVDMMGDQIGIMQEANFSAEKQIAVQQLMAAQFYHTAQESGATAAELDKLRQSLVILDSIDPRIDISLGLSAENLKRQLGMARHELSKLIEAQFKYGTKNQSLINSQKALVDSLEQLMSVAGAFDSSNAGIRDGVDRTAGSFGSAADAAGDYADELDGLNDAYSKIIGQLLSADMAITNSQVLLEGLRDRALEVAYALGDMSDAQRMQEFHGHLMGAIDQMYALADAGAGISEIDRFIEGLIGPNGALSVLAKTMGIPVEAFASAATAIAGIRDQLAQEINWATATAGMTPAEQEQFAQYLAGLEAGGQIPAQPTWSTGTVSAGSTTINVNLPPGVSGVDVVNALQDYAQTSGASIQAPFEFVNLG